MKCFSDKLYAFCLGFIGILMPLFTGLLFVSGFILTCFSTDMETQKVLTKWDNPLISLFILLLMSLLFFLPAAYMAVKGSASAHNLLRFFVLGWFVTLGILQIIYGKTVPAADAYSVYDLAQSLAEGDTSVIHPTDSYLSYYPQQMGLAAFWELLIRLWKLTHINQHPYHFLKIVLILLGCVIILYQEKIVHILWQDKRTDCLYLLLAGANCPFLMYTSFLYGEIPSFAAISIGYYFLLRFLAARNDSFPGAVNPPSDKGKIRKLFGSPLMLAAGSLCFLTISVMLRKNSLIFVIAAVLVILFTGSPKYKRAVLVFFAGLLMLSALLILPCIQKLYECRSGNKINSGVPPISYLAMGMQESSRANGWYNGFNFNTHQNTGMNSEATAALSKTAIKERLDYFREHPGYAVRFYLDKFLSQWVDGTYACRQATLATFGGRSAFFTSLYEGAYSKYLIAYCNMYQNILYAGAFWFCLTSPDRKRITGLPIFLGLISVFGGFLFHMLWEGNARYIFPYGLALLPYTARGLHLFGHAVSNTLHLQKST